MQILFNGIVSGLALAVLALAFQLVYIPTKVFFISLAGIYAAAPFVALAVLRLGGHWLVAVCAAVATCITLCLLCEWANHAPLSRRQASQSAHLIASLGVYIVLVQILAMVWGSDTKTFGAASDSAMVWGSLVITGAQWITLACGVSVLVGAAVFLTTSGLGLRLRALADNPLQFALDGHNVRFHRLVAFGVAGVLTAVSSLMTAYDVGIEPYRGLHVLLLAIIAVIVGGRGSFLGPLIGAFLIGILRDQVAWLLSARWQEAFVFALLSLFLLLRPQGLIGRRTRVEATP